MELLESERRILSPGCCTEEREKGREGGRKRGGGRELRTMRHAILLFYLKEKKRKKKFFFFLDRTEAEEKIGRVYTEIKHVTRDDELRLTEDGSEGNGEIFRKEMERETRNTDCGRHRRETRQRFTASPADKTTRQTPVSFGAVFFLHCTPWIRVLSLTRWHQSQELCLLCCASVFVFVLEPDRHHPDPYVARGMLRSKTFVGVEYF